MELRLKGKPVLFVKHGDYWVHTSKYARDVGQLLGLTVIKLDTETFQIGLPHYNRDEYATKLLNAGYCSLFEEPPCFAE